MLRRPTIPETAFPSALDPDNAIRAFYKTNLLYPAVGPAATTAYIMRMADVVRQLAIADSVFDRLREFRKRYGDVPVIPPQVRVLDPRVRNPRDYVEQFISTVRQHSLLTENGQIKREVREMGGMIPATAARPVSSHVMARGTSAIGIRGIDRFAPDRYFPVEPDKTKALDTAVLLRAFAVPNIIFSDLFNAGLLKAEGPIVTDDALLSDIERPHQVILRALGQTLRPGVSAEAVTTAIPMVRTSVRRVVRYRGADILTTFDQSPEFQNELGNYLLGPPLHDIPHPNWPFPGVIDPGPVPEIPSQREWAFQRYEELSLALGTPVLRGPVMATPVSPRSRHSRTDTETSSTRETISSRESRRVTSTETHQVVSASTFSQALDNLTESGIADASSFEQSSTLLSSLNEERRAVIDAVAREISTGAESRRVSMTQTSLGRSTEYWTEGKDQKLSTTELAFQVVVPAKGTVYLRDVGLAWCPRVSLPFSPLRANVRRHREEQEQAYITQSYVPVPVRPAAVAQEVSVYEFEIWIRGRKNVNKKNIERRIPLYDGAFVELNHITVTHRNGGWDDAEELPGYGSIPYNYDDLEHAVPYLENLSISASGLLTGKAVLETHDPEYLNVSWLAIKVPIMEYTPETIAAMAAYEAALQDREFKIEAVASRAKQFGQMKADELIEEYERTINVRREAFRALIRRVCVDVPPSDQSYFEEVLSRCVNWDEATMALESEDMADLSYRDLPPDHFMNSPAARFFMPIQKGAEGLFFGTLRQAGQSFFDSSIDQIRTNLETYRDQIAAWGETDSEELILDRHSTELVIGQHLEAVVSETDFANEI